MLETGIELEAKPSGKNVRKLSFFRRRAIVDSIGLPIRDLPKSAFTVLCYGRSEVAFDDINLHRFLELVAEFRRSSVSYRQSQNVRWKPLMFFTEYRWPRADLRGSERVNWDYLIPKPKLS